MVVRSDSWKALQREKRRQAGCELRQQRGYDANAHEQEDAERTRGRASGKTKEGYRERVHILSSKRRCLKAIKLGMGTQLLQYKNLKKFFRWLIDGTHGRLAPDEMPTRDTILNRAQEFVPGFYIVTGNEIARNDRDELYRNIELVSFRAENAPWRIGWRLDQQFVKNNKDPENTMFGTAIWDCDEPIYSGALYLLALTLADNALFGFSSPEEVFEQRIPEGEDELVLRWNEEAKDRCIIRGVTAGGVSQDPLMKEKYQGDFRKILANACYFVTATIHAMRRALGKAVRNKYSSAHAAQILTHKSKSIYGNDYLANCSSVDVVNALIGRPADHTHIEYFQGYGQFHEHGLPRRLPIEEEHKIDADPQLIAKATEIQNAESDEDAKRLKRDYSILKRKVYSSAFQRYQTEWVQNQRDWKVLTRGRERPDHAEQTAEKQAQCKLMPELGRLAAVMSSNESLSFDEKVVVVKDLYTQCLRDFDVVYCPGEEPVEGRCPVKSCGKSLETLRKSERSKHIHSCVRGEVSRTTGIPLKHVKYCWECFAFYDGRSSEFKEHCANHLPSMTSQHYEVMVYRNTIIRAGYCIDCMWDLRESAARRMTAFDRSTELRSHLDDHIKKKSWPSNCSDPHCKHISTDERQYRRHLHDVHHYNKAICVSSEKALKKRSSSEIGKDSIGDGNPPKRQRRPRKQRDKSLPPSHTSTKDLKIIHWEPPTTQPQAMVPLPAEAEHENEECLKDLARRAVSHCEKLSEAPCINQDSDSIHSASSDTPDLTDSSGLTAITSDPDTIPIDPRILNVCTATVYYSEAELEQHDERGLNEQLASNPLAKRPAIYFPSQLSSVDPGLEVSELKASSPRSTTRSSIPYHHFRDY
ncbi:hypothetical protein CNMCM5793_005925 [Aspergillus hiratsukae]|uniref:Uncharacterized protein n=1 Tax=Aspergillus hiratsukae TaxID=1194566 RepID=A0A8H6QH47_9EURO|nr:hypothetical protein CNMCM5793_005925 [Aspergillus hiratsukae]KAF7172578.1 hypothetical protein CNMCM6106_006754 [Aspergillus hiratsukae]